MRTLLLLLLAGLFLVCPCLADELTDAMPESAKEILGSDAPDADGLKELGDKLLSAFEAELGHGIGGAVRRAVSLVALTLIFSVLDIFGTDGSPQFLRLCSCGAVALVCIGDVGSFIRLGGDTLGSIADFSNVLLPALCTAGAVCGTPAAAAAKYAASALFMDILVNVSARVILPLVYAYTALVTAVAAFPNKLLEAAASLGKWLCKTLLTVLCLAFSLFITLSSAVSTAADAAAAKLTKTAMSLSMPLVGGMISDAASAVVAGAALVRNVSGVFGMLVVLAVCLAPFVTLGLNCLAFKAASAVTAAIAPNDAGRLLSGYADALGLLLALVGSGGVMMFISVISCVRAVSGL